MAVVSTVPLESLHASDGKLCFDEEVTGPIFLHSGTVGGIMEVILPCGLLQKLRSRTVKHIDRIAL